MQACRRIEELFYGRYFEGSTVDSGRYWLSFQFLFLLGGVILSEAVVQAELRIWRGASSLHARSLAPLVKARCFGMTLVSKRNSRLSQFLCERALALDPYLHGSAVGKRSIQQFDLAFTHHAIELLPRALGGRHRRAERGPP
jgi:hypothetical protein